MSDFNVVQLVDDQAGLFQQSQSSDCVLWEKEKQFAIQAFTNNDYLVKIARQNPISVQNAIINVAAIGVTLNPAAKLAYLVPRKGGVCLDISYMGLLHLAMSTGSIKWGQCKLVKENDEYHSNGLDKAPTHRYNAFKDRGDVIGGYCTVKTADGDYLTEEMSIDEINEIRDRSEGWKSGKNTPWKTDPSEMARKTIVKRASKYWPKVERLDQAINHLNTDGGEGLQQDAPVDVSPSTDEQHLRIDELMKSLGRDGSQLMAWLSKAVKRELSDLSDLTEQEANRAIESMEKMNADNTAAS